MKYLKQSTAATVLVGPFLDKADGLTPLTAVADQSSNGRLVKNGTGGAITLSSWAHDALGHYAVGLSTSHTDTLGRLRLSFSLPGTYCPVWEDFMVLPANAYDSLVGGSDALDVSVIQWLGTAPNALSSGRVDSVPGAYAAGQSPADLVLATPAQKLATDSSGRVSANLTQIDGQATSGYNATLKLKQLDIQNSGGPALNVAATAGTNPGAYIQGHNYAAGAVVEGGAIAGHGLDLISHGDGAALHTDAGTGAGIGAFFAGGANGGVGVRIQGGVSGGTALEIAGLAEGTTGAVISGGGKDSNGLGGDGLRIEAHGNGAALSLQPSDNGLGLWAAGGDTGSGIEIDGGLTGGPAVQLLPAEGAPGLKVWGANEVTGTSTVGGKNIATTDDITAAQVAVIAALPGAAPSAATVAEAVRTELAPELANLDVPVSDIADAVVALLVPDAPGATPPVVTPPANLSLCTVYGTLKSAANEPVVDATVTVTAVVPSVVSTTEMANTEVTTTTNDDGYFELQLARGAKVMIEIEAAGLRTTRTVPDLDAQNVATW